ncbi:MAG: hypothetical protein GF353_29015 [Candidatus Lokiarchaeota archaeon]|nr:hypothetical protein [Candidatus Lokiarchaeota archaeon]
MKTYKVIFDVSGCFTHIGADTAGIGVENVSEWVHSDTLFSAIIHAFSRKNKFGDSQKLIQQFLDYDNQLNKLPFRCSSVFLGKDDLFFVPKPKLPLPDHYDWSDLFKVKFISLENLYKWLQLDEMEWDRDIERDKFIKDVQEDWDRYRQLFITRVRAVNAKDRILNQTSVFHRGETIYADGTYMYFFMDINDGYEDRIRDAIQFLTDYAGFGGEINIGYSKMKSVSWQPFAFSNHPGKNNAYLLSLYPIYSEIDWENSWYDIINRKSRFNSPYFGTQLKKKAVEMISEGSCLSSLPSPGRLIDVTPDRWFDQEKKVKNWHRIHRNGMGYWIGF